MSSLNGKTHTGFHGSEYTYKKFALAFSQSL